MRPVVSLLGLGRKSGCFSHGTQDQLCNQGQSLRVDLKGPEEPGEMGVQILQLLSIGTTQSLFLLRLTYFTTFRVGSV